MEWIDQALSLPGADAHTALRVRALCIRSLGLWPLGRVAERPAVMAEAEAVARALAEPLILSQVLQTRATHEASEGRFEPAEPLAEEALRWASVAEDEWAIAMAAFSSAMAARSAGELRERVDRAAALLEGVGNVYQLATSSPPPPTGRCATAATTTRATSSTVRSRSRANSTPRICGCSCAGTAGWPRC